MIYCKLSHNLSVQTPLKQTHTHTLVASTENLALKWLYTRPIWNVGTLDLAKNVLHVWLSLIIHFCFKVCPTASLGCCGRCTASLSGCVDIYLLHHILTSLMIMHPPIVVYWYTRYYTCSTFSVLAIYIVCWIPLFSSNNYKDVEQ